MRLQMWAGICALLVVSTAIAQEQPKMSREEQMAMEAMMKAATPGDAHKKLAPMVGNFDVTVRMWPQPGAPATESHGTAENSWILGGRWVEQRFSGDFMGMPFDGLGYTGYDNIKQQYVSTWMDSMSTSVMVSNGTGSGDKSYEFTATVDDPVSGKPAKVKEKVTVTDSDHHLMEMWGPARDGQMFKMMEIAYSRKK